MNSLISKLSKVQVELTKNVKKDQKQHLAYKNGYSREYTHASLPAILAALNPLLNQHNIYMYQSLDCGHVDMNVHEVISTYYYVKVITHLTDGENSLDIPGVTQYISMADYSVQNASTCQTQAKRYSILSAFNISPEDDVDGNMVNDGWKSENSKNSLKNETATENHSALTPFAMPNYGSQLKLVTNFTADENKDKLIYQPKPESTPESDSTKKVKSDNGNKYSDGNVSADSLHYEINNCRSMPELNAIYAKASRCHLTKVIGKAWNQKKIQLSSAA